MQDLRTAALMALEALEQVDPHVDRLVDYSSTASEWELNLVPRSVVQAINALRAALAAEPEPVVGGVLNKQGGVSLVGIGDEEWHVNERGAQRLYTATPTAKPLTADEVFANNEIMAINADIGLRIETLMDLVRAIERAHGIGVQK